MPGPLLYSTNCYLKLLIQEKYGGDVHYVWCSESFDATKGPAYAAASAVAPSSNPCDVYKQLSDDVKRNDLHSAKISAQRASFEARAIEWHTSAKITEEEKEDIVWLAKNSSIQSFRPLIYVIPRAMVEARMKLVPAAKRASFGPEYIVPDLKRNEFDVLEVPHA